MAQTTAGVDSYAQTAQTELTASALRFARTVHLGQHRKQTDEQFVQHPIAVARLLTDAGYEGPIVAAAYLHDVVEKTKVEEDEIRLRFGDETCDIVMALTEDPTVDGYNERKRGLRRQVLESGRSAVLIYAADRVANMRDWRTVDPAGRAEVAQRLNTTLEDRLALWQEDLDELSSHDPDLPFLAEIEVDLRELRSDAAAA